MLNSSSILSSLINDYFVVHVNLFPNFFSSFVIQVIYSAVPMVKSRENKINCNENYSLMLI